MDTKGEVLSRLRNEIKAVKQDAFITDRFLYSMMMKHAKMLIRRQDSQNKIMKFNSVFQVLNYMELVEIDKAESGCHCITSGCIIKRTKYKLPDTFEGYFGPLIRHVSSLDMSQDVHPTYAPLYEKMSTQKSFKYNKTKYYWYSNGYLYFPNISWDAVRIEGLFVDDVSAFNCDTTDDCLYIQDTLFTIPEYLYSEIEQLILADLRQMMQIPSDDAHDKKNILK